MKTMKLIKNKYRDLKNSPWFFKNFGKITEMFVSFLLG